MTTMIEAARVHFAREMADYKRRRVVEPEIAGVQLGPFIILSLEDKGVQVSSRRYIVTACPRGGRDCHEEKCLGWHFDPEAVEARFCFVCGTSLGRGYPGGDPENGPARMQCPHGHDTVHDFALGRYSVAFAEDILRELADPNPPPGTEPALPEVRAAAETVLDALR